MSITPGVDDRSAGAQRHGSGRPLWRFTEAAVLLLLLTDGPSHGYQLRNRLQRMIPSDAAPPDPGWLYRRLRALEEVGSLRSSWTANPGAGPSRRVYEITDAGRNTLDGWVPSLAHEIQAVSGLLVAYYRAASRHGP